MLGREHPDRYSNIPVIPTLLLYTNNPEHRSPSTSLVKGAFKQMQVLLPRVRIPDSEVKPQIDPLYRIQNKLTLLSQYYHELSLLSKTPHQVC